MKKIATLLLVFQSIFTFAQAPQKMSYQAVIRNSNNLLVTNQAVGIKISVLQGSTTGSSVFAETQTPTTNENGLVSLEIGSGIAVSGTFEGINWANGPYYIQSEIDPTGGTNYTLTGAYQLMSVPYAMFSEKSGNGVPSGNNTGDLLSWNGTQWEAIANTAATTNINIPKVTTGNVDPNYCYNSTIVSDEGFSITAKGVCWSLSPNPTLADAFSYNGQGIAPYQSIYQNLQPSRLYYVRAYATNSRGTGYGMTDTFISPSTSLTIFTNQVTNITNNFATSGGSLNPSNNIGFTNSGVVWSTSPNPTQTSNTGVAPNVTVGLYTYTITLSGLTPNTVYYVRAYGETNYGSTVYGNQVSFTTGSLPFITTTAASEITTSSAQSGGTLTNPSGDIIIAKGVVWGINQNPTVALATKTIDGSTDGNFTSAITELALGTTYFVRAYVTNSLGTIYGNTITVRPGSVPTITTKVVTAISNVLATCGGENITNGGSVIIEKGIVWSTSPNPTIALATKTSDGGFNASFSSSITNLSYSTTYYVRAYARNQIGTAYGDELVFTTRTLQANDFYLGGQIIYILQTSDLGYVAGEIHGYMKQQIESYYYIRYNWGCNGNFMGTTSIDFGTGETNTIEIVNNCPDYSAAKFCYDLVDIGYDDWFLPSLNEASRFSSSYQKGYPVTTSSEVSQNNHYLFNIRSFGYNNYYSSDISSKNDFSSVIPVRRF